MTLARISLMYLRRNKLSTVLNVLLLAFGVAAVTLLVLTGAQMEQRIERDARGVDLIVGAKGSETQIVLSTLYDVEQPTGSVLWSEAQEIMRQPGIAQSLPLVLQDNYSGFRLVGATYAYVEHYAARLRDGRLWHGPMEVVLGADVYARQRPAIGSTLVAAHGLSPGGETHADKPYRVVGVLARTGTLIDRLVLTDVASAWASHPAVDGGIEGELVTEPPLDDGRRITSVLIRYSGVAAAGELPRIVNAYPDLQAASPGYELGRLSGIVAVGMDVIRGFAIVLMLSAALSIFIALFHELKERRYDLAVMRTLGATRGHVMALLLFEGLVLSATGALLGLALGHVLASLLGLALRHAAQVSITGWIVYPDEVWILAMAIAVGFLTALVPAWRARDLDIAGALARG